jgi:hypothetical protein
VEERQLKKNNNKGRKTKATETETAKGKIGKRIDCFIDCHTLAGSQ